MRPLLAAFVLLQAVGTYASEMNPAAAVVSNVTATSVLDNIVEALGGSQLIGAIHGISYTADTYDSYISTLCHAYTDIFAVFTSHAHSPKVTIYGLVHSLSRRLASKLYPSTCLLQVCKQELTDLTHTETIGFGPKPTWHRQLI